jgi:hypothetical protein
MTSKKNRKNRRKVAGKGQKAQNGREFSANSRGAGVTTYNVPPRNFLTEHTSGLPQTMRLTLTQAATPALSLPFATMTELTQVVNSAYNTGTSAQGYAKWMAFYSKCFVLGARIKVSFALSENTAGTTNTEPVVFGITIDTTFTGVTTVARAISDGLCVYDLLIQNPDSKQLNQGVDIARFLNKPKVLDDPQLFSTSAADPTQVVVAHVWAQNLASVSSQVFMIWETDYDCIFTDPIPFT